MIAMHNKESKDSSSAKSTRDPSVSLSLPHRDRGPIVLERGPHQRARCVMVDTLLTCAHAVMWVRCGVCGTRTPVSRDERQQREARGKESFCRCFFFFLRHTHNHWYFRIFRFFPATANSSSSVPSRFVCIVLLTAYISDDGSKERAPHMTCTCMYAFDTRLLI